MCCRGQKKKIPQGMVQIPRLGPMNSSNPRKQAYSTVEYLRVCQVYQLSQCGDVQPNVTKLPEKDNDPAPSSQLRTQKCGPRHRGNDEHFEGHVTAGGRGGRRRSHHSSKDPLLLRHLAELGSPSSFQPRKAACRSLDSNRKVRQCERLRVCMRGTSGILPSVPV